jgi:putative redox protein
MRAHIKLDQASIVGDALRLVGTNEKGHETFFDTSLAGGGLDSAASPMEIVLEALGACMSMDVVPILRKQRRTVTEFFVELEAERADIDPKVFTKIEMNIHLVSPDATRRDLARAIILSQSKYCSVSTMLVRGGCEVAWRATILNPQDNSIEVVSPNEFATNGVKF